MRVRPASLAITVALMSTACSGGMRHYEYEEQLYLTVKGSAIVVVDASIPALVALRNLAFDPSPTARTDQAEVRRVLEAGHCQVAHVGQPWIREGRRFIQVRIEADDVRTLGQCQLLAWSQYVFDRDEAGLHFAQKIGEPAAGNAGKENWKGDEVVAFKLHLPSRILYHNARDVEDGSPRSVERGNILTWEQRFTDRRAGKPIEIDTRIESQPILSRTLWLFGGSFVAAIVSLALIVWLVARRKPRAVRTQGS